MCTFTIDSHIKEENEAFAEEGRDMQSRQQDISSSKIAEDPICMPMKRTTPPSRPEF
jgi:hypothetical protein